MVRKQSTITFEDVVGSIREIYGLSPPLIDPQSLDFPQILEILTKSIYKSDRVRCKRGMSRYLRKYREKINDTLGLNDYDKMSEESSTSTKLINAVEMSNVP